MLDTSEKRGLVAASGAALLICAATTATLGLWATAAIVSAFGMVASFLNVVFFTLFWIQKAFTHKVGAALIGGSLSVLVASSFAFKLLMDNAERIGDFWK